MGDKSDNLAGIKGLGPKKLAKVIPEIVGKEINLDYLIHYASTQDSLMHKIIKIYFFSNNFWYYFCYFFRA
jgi:5'-3' exonuclease